MTRNYLRGDSCTCDNIFRKLSERMAKVISRCAFQLYVHILHKLPQDRRRKVYRLSQMIKRSFQHTAFFPWSVNSPSYTDVHSRALYRNLNVLLHPTTTLFPKVSRGPMVAHSTLFEFKTPHISKFSWSWVKQKKTQSLTLPNLQ